MYALHPKAESGSLLHRYCLIETRTLVHQAQTEVCVPIAMVAQPKGLSKARVSKHSSRFAMLKAVSFIQKSQCPDGWMDATELL